MQQLVQSIKAQLAQAPIDLPLVLAMQKELVASIPRIAQSPLAKSDLDPGRYLCYEDQELGFVAMLMVWGANQSTPIHDHGCWGVESVLTGELKVTTYDNNEVDPQPLSECVAKPAQAIYQLPPAIDIHKIANESSTVARSLHIYGKSMCKNRMFVEGQGYVPCELETIDLPDHLKQF